MTIKMYGIFCRETIAKMQGNEGKLASQFGHAILHAWWDAEKRWDWYDVDWMGKSWESSYIAIMREYKNGDDARKICLVVEKVEDLKQLYKRYRPHMGATLVEDCAYTVFTENTITAVGLGPVADDWFLENDNHLKKLELMRHEL